MRIKNEVGAPEKDYEAKQRDKYRTRRYISEPYMTADCRNCGLLDVDESMIEASMAGCTPSPRWSEEASRSKGRIQCVYVADWRTLLDSYRIFPDSGKSDTILGQLGSILSPEAG